MSDDEDAAYMRRALRLAARAAGRTSPNPLVGAVIVQDGVVVGEGYHHAAGEPHAEVNALGKAKDRARGATLYVNLEPCAHQGHTPPCVGAVRGRRYLSGKAALREVHRLRDRYDAVLVGIGTVLADDPALTVREIKGRDPLRVVVDADARTPPAAKVVRAKDPQRTIIFVARDADARRTKRLRDAGVLLATVPRADGGLDLAAVLRWLGERGVNTILSEAGPQVAGSLVRAHLADRLLLLLSPLAGGDGPPALERVPSAADLRDVRLRRLGDDLAIEGALNDGGSEGA